MEYNLYITSYRPVPPPVPGGPQKPCGALQGREGNGPGSGGVKELRAPRRSGPPARLLAQAPVQGSPRAPRGGPRGLWGTPGLPQESQGPPRNPQEPRAPSSLPSPLPFPSLLFPFPLHAVPGGPQDLVGGGGQDPPSGGPVSCLSL